MPSVSRLSAGLNLAGLALLVWGITTEAHLGLGGDHLIALLLLVVAVAGWVGWLVTRVRPVPHVAPISLAVMALAGGSMTVFATLAVTFVGVAAFGATMAWTLDIAIGLAAAGPLAMLVSLLAAGNKLGVVVGGVAAAVAGTVTGSSRRQAQEYTARAARVQVTEARAETERARAELLAGRNHLARELHDVLAHTLSALSVQLEALDALVTSGPALAPEVREQLDRTKRLVREGSDEARGAVQALREDTPPLESQLTRLAGERHAAVQVSGSPRQLSPDVSLTLYRVAQEALTNVVKHAPGADAEVRLGFDDDGVSLSVTNGSGGSAHGPPLAASGGGYGLQ
ncbi:MAG: sensor histidine kinase, partial [Acidimicrobiales bacterium]